MGQTIRLTVTPELEKALNILRSATSGTLNTTELIKLSVGELAQLKKNKKISVEDEITPEEMNLIGARQFYEWARSDGTLEADNISNNAKVKPFIPEPYVPDR